jgi:hypothetical protein
MKTPPIRDNRDPAGKTIPDPEDLAAIEAEHGPLSQMQPSYRFKERYMLCSGPKTYPPVGAREAALRRHAGDGPYCGRAGEAEKITAKDTTRASGTSASGVPPLRWNRWFESAFLQRRVLRTRFPGSWLAPTGSDPKEDVRVFSLIVLAQFVWRVSSAAIPCWVTTRR